MKRFWALPALIRVALASPHTFSVFDDLLAHPQYQVVFPDSYVSESFAASQLSLATSALRSTASHSQNALDLSHTTYQPADGAVEGDSVEGYEAITLNNRRYLCSIPVVKQDNNVSMAQSADEEEKELMRATDRGSELLRGMQGKCIYFLSGSWSYSFCHNSEVKQFHQLPPSKGVPMYPPVEDTTVQSFVLGKFPAHKDGGADGKTKESNEKGGEFGIAHLETKGETRYLVQRLGGGSTCDLTGKERRIEIQFHCNPGQPDNIGLIKEVSTCSYLMIIYTPRLCNDVAFLPPQENKPNPIKCHPIVAADQISEWMTGQQSDDEDELGGELVSQDGEELRPIVGGIEVGAKKDVGSEGRVIEKSVVVGGGKETFVSTVSSSDGKMLSREELRKLQTDVRDVEKLSKDLQKLAGTKGWKLDLVDTPRGREFRGIIMQEDAGEERLEGSEAESEPEEEGSEELYKEEL